MQTCTETFPIPAGWTHEADIAGIRFVRLADGKMIGRQSGSMIRFEAYAHVWESLKARYEQAAAKMGR